MFNLLALPLVDSNLQPYFHQKPERSYHQRPGLMICMVTQDDLMIPFHEITIGVRSFSMQRSVLLIVYACKIGGQPPAQLVLVPLVLDFL